MANAEQLAILTQGVEVWNRWRADNELVEINLRGAKLRNTKLDAAHLNGADLDEADLFGADLVEADLRGAHLTEAFLDMTHLNKANLSGAILDRAVFTHVDLTEADLTGANLAGAQFILANLRGANLDGVDLSGAILRKVDIQNCKLARATVNYTAFESSDLSKVEGLDEVIHAGPSPISTDTLVLSKGKIREAFLRGCGLSDWEIEAVKLYNPDLNNDERNKVLYKIYDLQASQSIQISPVFISYSHADSEFVDKLGNCLQDRGVRYWRDIHEMKAGRIETQIDRGIRQNPTVLLILSSNSLKSDWVEHEVRTARQLEKARERDVLCPIALDDSWKDSRWPKRVMEQIIEYNILDFSSWQDDSKFDSMFRKLIDGLELFYKG